MLKLLVFGRPKNSKILNFSPFCAKSEVYLKLSGVDHKVEVFTGNPGKFPKAKLPVLLDGDEVIADSHFIQKHIEKKFQPKLNAHLSQSELSQGFFMQKTLEEYLNWGVLCERWHEDENWTHTKEEYFGSIPSFIRPLITRMVRKDSRKSAWGHGFLRHTPEERRYLVEEGLGWLATHLQERKFLMGDQVSSFDAAGYGFLSGALYSDLNPHAQKVAQSHPSLLAYCARMEELLGL